MAKYESGRHRFLGQNFLPPERSSRARSPAIQRKGAAGTGKESGSLQCSRKRARDDPRADEILGRMRALNGDVRARLGPQWGPVRANLDAHVDESTEENWA